MKYPNLTKLTECGGFSIYMESRRYGDGILAGIDFPLQSIGKYSYFGRESVYEYIDAANCPGDIEAMNAHFKLCDFAENNKAFLFAQGKTLDECLSQLDERAALWLELNTEQQEDLLNSFIETQQSPSIVR